INPVRSFHHRAIINMDKSGSKADLNFNCRSISKRVCLPPFRCRHLKTKSQPKMPRSPKKSSKTPQKQKKTPAKTKSKSADEDTRTPLSDASNIALPATTPRVVDFSQPLSDDGNGDGWSSDDSFEE